MRFNRAVGVLIGATLVLGGCKTNDGASSEKDGIVVGEDGGVLYLQKKQDPKGDRYRILSCPPYTLVKVEADCAPNRVVLDVTRDQLLSLMHTKLETLRYPVDAATMAKINDRKLPKLTDEERSKIMAENSALLAEIARKREFISAVGLKTTKSQGQLAALDKKLEEVKGKLGNDLRYSTAVLDLNKEMDALITKLWDSPEMQPAVVYKEQETQDFAYALLASFDDLILYEQKNLAMDVSNSSTAPLKIEIPINSAKKISDFTLTLTWTGPSSASLLTSVGSAGVPLGSRSAVNNTIVLNRSALSASAEYLRNGIWTVQVWTATPGVKLASVRLQVVPVP